MTKQDFYKELKNIGVDVTNRTQMKVWSLGLVAMGKDYIEHRTDRCRGCYYENSALKDGKYDTDKCSNRFCPIKNMPKTPGEVVDYLFEQDFPLDIGAFFNKYVNPIITELVKQEEEQKKNAR